MVVNYVILFTSKFAKPSKSFPNGELCWLGALRQFLFLGKKAGKEEIDVLNSKRNIKNITRNLQRGQEADVGICSHTAQHCMTCFYTVIYKLYIKDQMHPQDISNLIMTYIPSPGHETYYKDFPFSVQS